MADHPLVTGHGAAGVVLAGLALTALLTACGEGDGSGSLPSPTRSVTGSLPSPTVSPSRDQGPDPTEAPTETSTETPTETATATETATTTETATVTATPSTTEEPSPGTTQASEDTDDSAGGLPAWGWLLLAGGALAAVAALLVRRSRRRRSWHAGMVEAEAEAAWFAHELLPQLQRAASPDEVAGGWRVAAPRVTSIEDRFTGLEVSAPDEASRSRARRLRDAVREARHAVDDLVLGRDRTVQARDLASTSSRLDSALGARTPP